MFFKSIISILSAVLLATSLTGCGSGNDKKKNVIVMWLVGSEAQAQKIVEISKTFTETTGVKVDCQAISWGDAHSKYLTAIAGEVTPDIGTMGLTWGMEFGELGAMIDLKANFPEDVAVLDKENFPGLVESTKLGNKMYGVPLDFSEHIVYYRTDIISEAPKDWDSLLAVLKKLKAENRGMVLDWGSLEWIGFAPFLWQAGGDFFSDDYRKITMDSPEGAKALEYFTALYKGGVPITRVPLEQGMRTGDYPIAISGNWKVLSLQLGAPEIAGKWSVAMLPQGPSGKRTAFIGGRIMGIFSRSKMAKESWEFIKFLSTPESQLKLYNSSLETDDLYLPPNMKTWELLGMDAKIKKVLMDQAQDAKGPPPVLGWDAATRFVDEAVQLAVLKNKPAAEVLRKAADDMREELKMH
ncbi:MAG: extracellular solute-binding protein [Candidatus Omnitrophica bacterium]|nr:extracellular solute-binding protein [Candidatus Omnitrophota bacterium]